MSTTDLPEQLRQIADFSEIRGTDDALEWRLLADAVDSVGAGDRAALIQSWNAARLQLPPTLERRWQVLATGGPAATHRRTLDALPWLLRWLLASGTIDPPAAVALSRYGVVTPGELEAALRDGRIRQHLPAGEERLRAARERIPAERPLVPLGRAADLLDGLAALLVCACPDLDQVTPAGDVRRLEPLADWLAIVAAAPNPREALDLVCLHPATQPIRHRTERRAILTYQQHEIDVRIAAPDEVGSLLWAATGSHAHLAAVQARQRTACPRARESDEYERAGLPWIPPELRQNGGEIEAAAAGTLPDLVERHHIRGDLHMHTFYSDGRDSVAAMVEAAAALGYDYVAITDHSERSFASRTLSLDQLARQREEIAELRERVSGLVILHGMEVDIMPDGRLDFPDEVLEGLDIVLASLHDRAGHDDARLTRRCLEAIRHPLVNIITHPANRVVGRDSGYALDFPAIFAAAVETGTALEIDGAPGHLDMDGLQAKAAVEAGVTVVIDSDCHRASLLDRQMRFGVGTARRGWVEPRHVLNTRPVGDVRAFVAAKRRGTG